jgi:2,3-bisphosphoglycerate-dependent phosphoglycerate mutase
MKEIYLVRHCKAEGQAADAPLTEDGSRQSFLLAHFLKHRNIEYIVSSPYVRAIQTIKPLSEIINKGIHTDDRLKERVLSTAPLENWMEMLQRTFDDDELRIEGGETSREAAGRGLELIQELTKSEEKSIVAVTHGALMSLIIKHFDRAFGFNDWKALSNPDVFQLTIQGQQVSVRRIWGENSA